MNVRDPSAIQKEPIRWDTRGIGRTPGIDKSKRPNRVRFIDVVRGLLMCVIVFGHVFFVLDDSAASEFFKAVMVRVVNLGTPGFTAVSGMLFGFFEVTRREMYGLRRKYFKRGIQLLTVAHFLIAAGVYYPLREGEPFLQTYLNYWFITDTLAILFILLPPFLIDVRPRYRLYVGMALLGSWRFVHYLSFDGPPFLLVLRDFLFGVNPKGTHILSDAYPIVPLLGLFLVGTVLGNRFGAAFMRGTVQSFHRRIQRGILPSLSLSVPLVAIWMLHKVDPAGMESSYLAAVFFPDKLYSLLPFYWGIFLAIVSYFIWKVEIRGSFGLIEKVLSVFGRTSLFTYVTQYFLVQTFPYFMGWQGELNIPQMLLFLSVGLTVLYLLSFTYEYILTRYRRWKRPALQNGSILSGQGPEIPAERRVIGG